MSRFGIGVLTVLLCATAVAAQEPPRTDGWVVLSLDEYRALRARAFPTPADPSPPPVDATLTRVDYELSVTGETVTGQARLAIDVLKQGWVSVQAPAGVLVRDARLEGRLIALVDGDPPRVLLSRTGRSTLTLDIVVPLAAAAGTESIALPPTPSAVSAVTLVIPRTGVDLTVSGGLVAEQVETAGETRWIAYGNAGHSLTFSWKRRSDDRRASLPLRTRARITELVALGEDTFRTLRAWTFQAGFGGLLAEPPDEFKPSLVDHTHAGEGLAGGELTSTPSTAAPTATSKIDSASLWVTALSIWPGWMSGRPIRALFVMHYSYT